MSHTTRALLERALPLLVRLGDYIGNGPVDEKLAGSLGQRCDLILDIWNVLDSSQTLESEAKP